MNKPLPENFLFHILEKQMRDVFEPPQGCTTGDSAANEPVTVPYAAGETNDQFHERMAALARAAFRVPEGTHDNSIDYDGDGGRNWREDRGVE